eukprot:4861748-Pleurochrysis_carterae.AAC.1
MNRSKTGICFQYPRAANRQHHEPESFMITSRIGKKSRGGNGFAKKSARLSTLRTKGTVIWSSSTF